jgi:hypothetical protein
MAKPIKHYEDYKIDENGNVFLVNNNLPVRVCYSHGYKIVRLKNKHGAKFFRVHRLVAMCYHASKEFEGAVVNHLDGNKLNNHFSNLEWCTRAENVIHAYKIGLHKNAEQHHFSRLSNQDILNIKSLYSSGTSQVALSKRYNVGQDHISRIINNKRRRHG